MGTWSFLWYRYRYTLPRSPEPTTGRVYAMDLRGVTIYATHNEREQLHLTIDVSLGLIGIGIVAGFLTDPEYRRKMGWESSGDTPPKRSQ